MVRLFAVSLTPGNNLGIGGDNLASWRDEILRVVPGDQSVVARYDLIDQDDVIIAENVQLRLKNEIEQEGTKLDAQNLNSIETRLSATTTTANAAQQTSTLALQTAQQGVANAGTAQSTAVAAGNKADTARSKADAADSKAVAADTKAGAAQTTATNALGTANGALQRAGGTMTGALYLSGNPTGVLQATPKQYVDSATTSKVNRGGDTMNGALVAGGSQAIGTPQMRNIVASTTDISAGSALATGQVYIVYE